jgi:hypothetical protein
MTVSSIPDILVTPMSIYPIQWLSWTLGDELVTFERTYHVRVFARNQILRLYDLDY